METKTDIELSHVGHLEGIANSSFVTVSVCLTHWIDSITIQLRIGEGSQGEDSEDLFHICCFLSEGCISLEIVDSTMARVTPTRVVCC